MPNSVEHATEADESAFFMKAQAHEDDPQCLAAMRAYDILEQLPLDAFDSVAEMAADIFDAPIAAIRVADADRIWCRSPSASDKTWRGTSPNFSGFTREAAESWRLTGRKQVRSLTMPLVAIEFGLRFYVSVPLTTPEGHEVGTLCVIDKENRPVNERQVRQLKALGAIVIEHMELRLSGLRAASHSEILAGEVDHRVMNSLQFVAGLLEMQSRSVRSSEAAAQLTLAASRVASVARVHRHFAINNEMQRVPILAYLRRLCGELSNILDIPIEVSGSEASIPSHQILAIGFSVNEFITNAKKHGAPPIKVSFLPDRSGQHQLSVMDEGAGLPEDFALGQYNRSDGLGMRVVTALTAQLAGALSVETNAGGRGARFTITFPQS